MVFALKSFRILPKGRYHSLLMSIIHEGMKKYLSELYSRKLKELLGVSAIEFRYIPVSFPDYFTSLTQYVDSLELEKYCPFVDSDQFIIPIPVRNLCEEFTVTYSGAESITITNNNIEIPFGEALALFAFTGNEIMLSYVDPGYDTDVTVLLKKILEKSKKTSEFPYSTGELKNSLKGRYSAPETCSFCGSPASEVISAILSRDRFTDVALLFNDRAVAAHSKWSIATRKFSIFLSKHEF